ncbi:GNAT family N-acetyltransferase [Elongatibacter sediminis]|uniref:GNAT family N-acetyltransferase n=1 Tax=Elongatibacter sediminis TaxID=3119006 RepID=A0AAW9RLW2_9GAMM
MVEPATAIDVQLDGQRVTIRPISSIDANLEVGFIDRLSPMTKHYRFLGGMHHISEQLLKEFCDVDFDQTAAFIAITEIDGEEREIGVVRYAPGSTDNDREMAITIADNWQNKGLDVLLAKQLIDFAKTRGVKKLYSIDLADNAPMRQLANDLGMSVGRDPDDAHQVIYTLNL